MKTIDIGELDNWPKSWAGYPKDEEYGKRLVEVFKPFGQQLIDVGYSYRTIKDHIDNLWMLGGRIIKDLYFNEESRKLPPVIRLTHYIDSWDGPMIEGLTENEQNSFDRTCRKLYKYLVVNFLRR